MQLMSNTSFLFQSLNPIKQFCIHHFQLKLNQFEALKQNGGRREKKEPKKKKISLFKIYIQYIDTQILLTVAWNIVFIKQEKV